MEDSIDTCVLYHTNTHIHSNDSESFLPYEYSYDDDNLSYFDTVEHENDHHRLSSFSYSIFNGEVNNNKPRQVSPSKPNYKVQRPLFAWLPVDTIKRTYHLTTQYSRLPMSTILKKRYRSPNPALNFHNRSDPVATDTIFSNTPAVDSGVTCAQFFVGCDTMVCDAYPMKTSKQFVNTLEDNIRERGAMNRLVSDLAEVKIISKVKDILRTLLISSWQSKAYYQHQNPAERRFQTVKNTTNTVLDRTVAPPSAWILCLLYVILVLNHTFCSSINAVPLQCLNGSTPDISPLLSFHFWEEFYYRHDDSDFPSESREGHGRFVGIAEHVGHAMTYKILTSDTHKLIYRSSVRSDEKGDLNLRADIGRKDIPSPTANDTNIDTPNAHDEKSPTTHEDTPPIIVRSRHDEAMDNMQPKLMLIVNPKDLIGRTFLLNEQEDGQKFRAKIVEAINKHHKGV